MAQSRRMKWAQSQQRATNGVLALTYITTWSEPHNSPEPAVILAAFRRQALQDNRGEDISKLVSLVFIHYSFLKSSLREAVRST